MFWYTDNINTPENDEWKLTLPLVMAPVTAGAKKPVAEPRVLVRPFRVPAKFGAISCSDKEQPLLIGPIRPTARHITTIAKTGSQLIHIIPIKQAAEQCKPEGR